MTIAIGIGTLVLVAFVVTAKHYLDREERRMKEEQYQTYFDKEELKQVQH